MSTHDRDRTVFEEKGIGESVHYSKKVTSTPSSIKLSGRASSKVGGSRERVEREFVP